MKKCVECGNSFKPKTSSKTCTEKCRKEQARRYQRGYIMQRRKEAGKLTGIGSGNHPTNRGETAPNYSTGISFFHKYKKEIMGKSPFCARCSKELFVDKPYERCLHHKDHDRTNNIPENYELLCKSCHQKEHDSHKHLNKRRQIELG